MISRCPENCLQGLALLLACMQVAFEVFKGVNAAPLLLLLLLSNQQLIGVQCLLILVRLGHLYLWQLTLIITHYYVLSHNQVTNWFEQVL